MSRAINGGRKGVGTPQAKLEAKITRKQGECPTTASGENSKRGAC